MAAAAHTNARPHKVKLVKRVLLLPENTRNTGVEKVQANVTCILRYLRFSLPVLQQDKPAKQRSKAPSSSSAPAPCTSPVYTTATAASSHIFLLLALWLRRIVYEQCVERQSIG